MASFIRTTFGNLLTMLNVSSALNQIVTDANRALEERVAGRRVEVHGYSATGATTTKLALPVELQATAWGVLLVRAFPTADPAADIAVSGRINFAQSGTALYVFEPSGLMANTPYDLTFLVLE